MLLENDKLQTIPKHVIVGCICVHIIAFGGESVAKMCIGNWSDCETMMQEKFGKDLTPHRVYEWGLKI